jgi:hypothetical protein
MSSASNRFFAAGASAARRAAVGRVLGIVVLALAGVSACAHVPAYDRANLAHPTMAREYGESAGRQHLLAVHEGARGAITGHASSGCGCN